MVGISDAISVLVHTCATAVLASTIAYHPEIARKRNSLSDMELPKTVVIYAIIGMMVGFLIGMREDLAQVIGFTIFGLGGLMRFRTDVGSAKETGRLIFVTLGGLCVGLGLYSVAVSAFAVIWLMVLVTERRNVFELFARFEEMEAASAAAKTYRNFLKSSGWNIVHESRGSLKPEVKFVFSAQRHVGREEVIQYISNKIPLAERGVIEIRLQ